MFVGTDHAFTSVKQEVNMWKYLRRLRKSEKGQSATEYMLIIAVVVLGLLAAASKIVPMFRTGVETLGTTINEKYLSNNPDFCDSKNGEC